MLGTQAIRGGANREVLKRIKQSGDIFFAISDRDWILDGANVHVSMIGFDDGIWRNIERSMAAKFSEINSNLTAYADVTTAKRFTANFNISCSRNTEVGRFRHCRTKSLANGCSLRTHTANQILIFFALAQRQRHCETNTASMDHRHRSQSHHEEFALYEAPYLHTTCFVKAAA